MEAYQGIGIFGEQRDGVVQVISYKLLTRGRQLADRKKVALIAVMLGRISGKSVVELIKRGTDRILLVSIYQELKLPKISLQ